MEGDCTHNPEDWKNKSIKWKCGETFKESKQTIDETKTKHILCCQPRVTVTSRFVYKVITDEESIDHLCINPIFRIGFIHKWSIDSRMLKWRKHISVSLSNCKQSITSLSLLVGTTLHASLDEYIYYFSDALCHLALKAPTAAKQRLPLTLIFQKLLLAWHCSCLNKNAFLSRGRVPLATSLYEQRPLQCHKR